MTVLTYHSHVLRLGSASIGMTLYMMRIKVSQVGWLAAIGAVSALMTSSFCFSRCCARPASARQVPAQQLARAAIDHQRQAQPAILASPYAAQIRPPSVDQATLPWILGLEPRALPKRPLAHLPALELEDCSTRYVGPRRTTDLRPAVQRLISSSITSLIGVSSEENNT